MGLLFFSVMSLGYARSSEQDAKVLDQAVVGLARSLQPSYQFWDRLGNLVRLPFQAVRTVASTIFSTLLLPFHFVQHTLARIEYTYEATNKGVLAGVAWISNTMGLIAAAVSARGKSISGAFGGSMHFIASRINGVTAVLNGVWRWTETSFDSLYSWWARAAAKAGQINNSLSRDASTKAWIVMDSVCWYLNCIHDYFVAFTEYLTGSKL
jgi:hypothetical protein